MNGNLKAFAKAQPKRRPLAEVIEEVGRHGVPPHEAVENYDRMCRLDHWLNDEYQVAIDKEPAHGFGTGITIWHLSIKRLDRKPIHDWRDLQQIKNLLCGPDTEAFEIYPAQKRVVDTSNQYHLYALMADGERAAPPMPIGWQVGMILEPDQIDGSFHGSKAMQRPGGKR